MWGQLAIVVIDDSSDVFQSKGLFGRGLGYTALTFTSSRLLCCHPLKVESGLQQNFPF